MPNKRLGLIYEQEKDYENSIKYSIGALNNNKYCLESAIRVLRILHKLHSETEIYNFFSENILTDNKDFIQKILIFALNQGWAEFATFLSHEYHSENKLMKYLIQLKIDIIKGNNNTYLHDNKLESSFLLSGLNSAIIDVSDIFILYNNMENEENRRTLEILINNSNLYSILSMINNEDKEQKLIDADGYIHLLEKCVSFQKFDLLNKLIEMKGRVGIDIDVKIARVFYNKGYEDEAIEFYQLANEDSLTESDFNNIIEWLISKEENQEAYRISLDVIKRYKDDFRFYKFAICLCKELGSIDSQLFQTAFDLYPDSSWLRSYLSNDQKEGEKVNSSPSSELDIENSKTRLQQVKVTKKQELILKKDRKKIKFISSIL